MSTKTMAVLGLATGLGLTLPATTRAGVPHPSCGDDDEGSEPIWQEFLDETDVLYLDWYLNDTYLTDEQVRLVIKAAEVWNLHGSSRVQFRYQGRTDNYVGEWAGNCLNEVVFYGPDVPSTRTAAGRSHTDDFGQFDITLYSVDYQGNPMNTTPNSLFDTAVHEFGHALGMAHHTDTSVMSVMNNKTGTHFDEKVDWPMLTTADIECLREGLGYGYVSREVGVSYRKDGESYWHPTYTFGLESAAMAPAVAGNEHASSSTESFLAAWTDEYGQIITRVGDGVWFRSSTEVVHDCPECTSPYPPAVAWAPIGTSSGFWTVSFVSGSDLRIRHLYSRDGLNWYGPVTDEPTGDGAFICGPPAIGFNEVTGDFLVAAVTCAHGPVQEPDESIIQRVVVWDGPFPGLLDLTFDLEEPWLVSRAWEVGLSCNEADARCTLAYRDYYRPDAVGYRDLYWSNSEGRWKLSNARGWVETSADGLWGPRIAHPNWGTPAGAVQPLVTVPWWAGTGGEPGAEACQRMSGLLLPDWSCSDLGTREDIAGHVSVASSEYRDSYFAWYTFDDLGGTDGGRLQTCRETYTR